MLSFAFFFSFKEEVRNSGEGCGELRLKAVTVEELKRKGGWRRSVEEGREDCRGMQGPTLLHNGVGFHQNQVIVIKTKTETPNQPQNIQDKVQSGTALFQRALAAQS